ncbi:HTH-type transcriptional regulator LrpC [Paraliobacillus ryukyuensis]|uniref:AsnC family transcriptional regulator n=1 Tax=Paraliobacillus ryukyuensis TaxID=200904 RepID=A0A366DYI8_9BACI|nr:Lrp/AsnC family transcriptional regulator [Paraliobacillus ryukyuensis]RBO95170.1 AsnC family transcriptional regulator [Paraliobacillus ryukyuensis]
MELDPIDVQILQILSKNARIQWKDLGKRIHMTGQAVGNRIKKLEDNGIITSYTLLLDEMKLGLSFTAFVIMYMNSANHQPFIRFINERKEIIEVHRISGKGCYHLMIKITSQEELNHLLNQLLKHGNYNLNLSIHQVKKQHPLTAYNK